MTLAARILTPIQLPEKLEVEIKDSVRGTTQVLTVDFNEAMQALASLGPVDLHEMDPAELIRMACALAKHRAIDRYLVSIGVDPHKDVHVLDGDSSPTGGGPLGPV
jgi:hypothetical protein